MASADTFGRSEFYPEWDEDHPEKIDVGFEQLDTTSREAETLPESARGELSQYESAFSPNYGLVSGSGGLNFSLQSFDRKGWGNPTWTYYEGRMPQEDKSEPPPRPPEYGKDRYDYEREYATRARTPLRMGSTMAVAPTTKYYTNALYRPLYDFTTRGGGWMPENPFQLLGGAPIAPEYKPNWIPGPPPDPNTDKRQEMFEWDYEEAKKLQDEKDD